MTKKNNFIKAIIYALVGIIVLLKGVVYYPDSYAFLDMAMNHSPVYSIFLNILTGIFGSSFELPLIIIQYGVIIYATNFCINSIGKVFQINTFSFLFVLLILLAPCVYLHFLCNSILTEAFSYALFLIVFSFTFKMLVEEKLSYIYKTCLALFFLILTRGQFISFIPVLALVTLYILYRRKSFIKNIKFLIILIALPFLTSFAEKLYNKVVFGYYVNNAMNYVHLITSPFYTSNQSDVNLFDDKNEKAYFELIYNSLKEERLTLNQNLSSKIDEYAFYHKNFSKICNKRIYKLGLEFYEKKGLNYYEQNIALNTLCAKMVFPLLKKNYKSWFNVFFKNLKNAFGSLKQMLLFLFLFVYSLIFLIKSNKSMYKFIVLATLLMFANNTLVALVIHSIKRYIFYFDWVIFAIVILLLNEFLNKSKAHES